MKRGYIFASLSYIFSIVGGLVLWMFYFYNIMFLSRLQLESCIIDQNTVNFDPPGQNYTASLLLNLTFTSSFAELFDSVYIMGTYNDLIVASKTKYKVGEMMPCLVYTYGFYGQIINRTFHRMFMGNIYISNPIDYTLSYVFAGLCVVSLIFFCLDICSRFGVCDN
jgi:hypothetical protein